MPSPLVPRPRPILLVEDEDDIRELLAMSLRYEGYTVIEARDGAEGFRLARAHDPGLILLDLMMPVMSGEEFRRAQLAQPSLERIPVVVISARHDVPATARAMNVAGYMTKPLDLDALTALVARHYR